MSNLPYVTTPTYNLKTLLEHSSTKLILLKLKWQTCPYSIVPVHPHNHALPPIHDTHHPLLTFDQIVVIQMVLNSVHFSITVVFQIVIITISLLEIGTISRTVNSLRLITTTTLLRLIAITALLLLIATIDLPLLVINQTTLTNHRSVREIVTIVVNLVI